MSSSSRWLVRQAAGPVQTRLVCLPYAGGNARVFRCWAEALQGVEILAVEAPGKGGRMLEAPCGDIDTYCRSLMADLLPLISGPQPFSFFGHSNGAIIAFELCCRLQAIGAPMPQHLILSACGAPWARVRRSYSTLDDKAFKTLLHEFRATPPEILTSDALLDLMLPGLRADFAIGDLYECTWPALRGVAAHVFSGTRDAIGEDEIAAWQDWIESPVAFETIDGGHFYIHEERDALIAAIARQLSVEPRYGMSALAI